MADSIQLGVSSLITILYHPIAYPKTLIQLGYEPMPPVLSHTLFGTRTYLYPNVFKYANYIYTNDGFFGLFKGLGSKLIGNAINITVFNHLQMQLMRQRLMETNTNYTELDCVEVGDKNLKYYSFFETTMSETISRVTGLVLSYPFYVISYRCMGQFVGKETTYTTLFGSIAYIWNTEGLPGFFEGIVPRIVGEILTIWISNALTYVFNNVVASATSVRDSQTYRPHTSLLAQLVANHFTYHYTLISTIMAVNSSHLAVANLPIIPKFSSWFSCWDYLASINQTRRGSSLFWRRHTSSKIPPIQGSIGSKID